MVIIEKKRNTFSSFWLKTNNVQYLEDDKLLYTGVQKPISTRSCHSKHQLQQQPKTAYDMYSEIIEESSFIIKKI